MLMNGGEGGDRRGGLGPIRGRSLGISGIWSRSPISERRSQTQIEPENRYPRRGMTTRYDRTDEIQKIKKKVPRDQMAATTLGIEEKRAGQSEQAKSEESRTEARKHLVEAQKPFPQ